LDKYFSFTIVILFILFIVFIFRKPLKLESFYVAENSNKIPENPIESDIQKETDYINSLFLKFNDPQKLNIVNPWIYFPQAITPDITSTLTINIITFLENGPFLSWKNVSGFKLDLFVPFYDIYYYDISDFKRRITFDTYLEIRNPNSDSSPDPLLSFSSRRVNITMDINTKNSLKLMDIFLVTVPPNSLTFDYINLTLTSDNSSSNYTIQAVNEDDNIFKIENVLHLLTPFTTSYNDHIITQEMQNKFDAKLKNILALQTATNITNSTTGTNGQCFGLSNSSLFTNQNDCETYGEIWDTPPVTNFDCPFYEKNTNYTNQFGGIQVINGKNYCQMPLGIKQTSYKTFDKNSTPICKDINNNNIESCTDQTNPLLYPKLKSPNYIFPSS
jgi:hypothetical protein